MKAAQADLGLTPRQLQASSEVHRNAGNTSSVAVLAVLEQARKSADGQEGRGLEYGIKMVMGGVADTSLRLTDWRRDFTGG